jgi:hypothetical protein
VGTPEQVRQILIEMEQDLIASYHRNMRRHTQLEAMAGFTWEQWQLQKLADLKKYNIEAMAIIDKSTKRAKEISTGMILDNFKKGASVSEKLLGGLLTTTGKAEFFSSNKRKMDALVDAIDNDFNQASIATLRLVNDKYRKIVFKSQVMFNMGGKTLGQAIDLAASDFLHDGINSIRYKNGALVNISSYAEMALRTSNKRAYLTGEGAMNNELGVYTVQVSSYGGCSETCLPWQGRVYVDDVYNSGKADGKHRLLSLAISNGLYHPNCKHTHGPYLEGITSSTIPFSRQRTQKVYQAEQKQRYIERKIREWKRVREGGMDNTTVVRAKEKVAYWQKRQREHLKTNSFLSRKYAREKG